MIKNKTKFYLALFFLFTTMVLNLPFPHESLYGETIVSAFNIPIRSVNGFHYIGISLFLLFLISIYLLINSLEKYHGRIVILAIILVSIGPSMIASSFQKTIATGIYAINYERDLSSCHFEKINETTLLGECKLPFQNFNRNDVHYTIEFYEKYYFEDDIRMLSLMNNDSPYEVELKGHERKTVKIKTYIDVSNMENHIENGEASSVNIIIKSGEKSRRL
ncbi:hypothetical protein [Bacillus sp. FJAT-50079]|uniref:hypothetical protein n=1 Tax=Bacillus sp. FJAT-50079 TaxID=2833577 RepID=UPI001BC93E2E|nr:hypothetical protein [Bacillus sp. FJAT-50079]MBS4209512.1 hypothetical protein [Bacillus sp. FJAT-50079]